MNEVDKAAQAEENRKATEEAHRLAAEHRARDAAHEPPLIQTLQSTIKEKLEKLPPEPTAQENNA